MEKRFKTPSMVFVLFFRNNNKEILLQKRKNTEYMDGYWDATVGGHLESNESVLSTAIRETKEEVCIDITAENLKFAAVYHNNFNTGKTYFDFYFEAVKYNGTPKIGDPQKLDDLCWFPVEELPINIIANRKTAIKNYLNGEKFGALNW
jgi:8-oxo-dGTP pyrophosphatase MutT (NUDIX family)